MDPIEQIPVKTGAGDRRSDAVADRLLIGLAAAVLLIGLLLAAGNLLEVSPDPVGMESAQPTRTALPSESARPLGEVTVIPAVWPSPPNIEGGNVATHWVLAADDLPIRSSADDGSPLIGSLAAGRIGLGAILPTDGPATWMQLRQPRPKGWVRITDDDGAAHAEVIPLARDEESAQVTTLAAGGSGYFSHIFAGPGSVGSSVTSADGETWQLNAESRLPGPAFGSVAWGPTGWLAALTGPVGDASIWESGDGVDWAQLGTLSIKGQLFPNQLVGSPIGYLMTLGSAARLDPPAIWFSPDGVTWQESADPWPLPTGEARLPRQRRLLGTDEAFVAWQWNEVAGDGLKVAISRDGRSWRDVPIVDRPVSSLDVAVVGGSALALGHDADGHTFGWIGSFSGEAAGLHRDPGTDRQFAGARVTATTSDGTSAYAFGYATDSGMPLAWVGDGEGWKPLAVPAEGFGQVVRAAAAGDGGVVVAGARLGVGDIVPAFWHLRADGSWVAEATPAANLLFAPPAEECPPVPTSALAFAALEAGRAVKCFGDLPMTFNAWSGDCRACWRHLPSMGEPTWLVQPDAFLQLMPYQGYPDQGWARRGVLDRELAWDDGWPGHWVRITGHYDDPAAASCGLPPPQPVRRGFEFDWLGSSIDIWRCERTFVVNEVNLISQP